MFLDEFSQFSSFWGYESKLLYHWWSDFFENRHPGVILSVDDDEHIS